MADIFLRAPMETPIFDENGYMSYAWQQFFATLDLKLSNTVDEINDALGEEIVDLNISGKFFMDGDVLIDDLRNLVDIKDIDAENLTLSEDASVAGDASVGGQVSSSTLTTTGNAVLGNDVWVGNDLAVSNDISGQDVTVNNNLTVDVDATIGGDLDVSGTLTTNELWLSDTVWDDLRVPLQNTKINPLNSEPAFENFADGLYAYAFEADNGDTESLHFVAQLPHSYKHGTDLGVHVHWMPSTTNTGNVVWELEYTWANINDTFPASGTLTATDAADGTALKHQLTGLGTLDGTGKGLSSMIIGRLTRLGTDGADTFTGVAYGIELDFHYELDALGSREEYVK